MVYSDSSVMAQLDQLFVNVNQTYTHHWPYTFAHLAPTDGHVAQPILLSKSPGLYNVNSMESLASAMEISSIGGRNVARHAVQHIRDLV